MDLIKEFAHVVHVVYIQCWPTLVNCRQQTWEILHPSICASGVSHPFPFYMHGICIIFFIMLQFSGYYVSGWLYVLLV